jgi:hypothetical protein
MQFDFSNVRAQEVPRDRTAIFTFYRLEGTPRLTVRPATEANPAYMRAILKGSRENLRRLKAGDLSPEMLEENRAKDRKLFPKLVVVSWDGVLDVNGAAVPFSADACAAFIEALPYDLFNELRDFCSTIDNFRPQVDEDDDEPLTSEDRADIVGN